MKKRSGNVGLGYNVDTRTHEIGKWWTRVRIGSKDYYKEWPTRAMAEKKFEQLIKHGAKYEKRGKEKYRIYPILWSERQYGSKA